MGRFFKRQNILLVILIKCSGAAVKRKKKQHAGMQIFYSIEDDTVDQN